jgi:osmotically inducible protein OsmC
VIINRFARDSHVPEKGDSRLEKQRFSATLERPRQKQHTGEKVMPTRKAHAIWNGTLKEGHGEMTVESGSFKVGYSFGTRFGDEKGTNPEELIGAAHAGCFSMAFSLILEQAGFQAQSIDTEANVKIEKVGEGFRITGIHLSTRGRVSGIDAARFTELAEQAKAGCPVSQALVGPTITMDAQLLE